MTQRKSRGLSYLLVFSSIAIMIVSVILSVSILALIGLGLLFWGIILTFVKTDDHIKKTLANASFSVQISAHEVLKELGYNGPAIYLPPKYFDSINTVKIRISKNQPNEMLNLSFDHLPATLPQKGQYLLLTPPGLEMMQLFEDILKVDFTCVDLPYLQQNLPKLLVEELEVTNSFGIKSTDNIFSAYFELGNLNVDFPSNVKWNTCFVPGLPLFSAIACAMAKATGKAIWIKSQTADTNGNTAIVDYQLFDLKEEPDYSQKADLSLS